MSPLFFTIQSILILIAVRAEVVYRARKKAIAAAKDIGELDKYLRYGWVAPYGYDWMMFDLTKWTFAQFYRDLAQRAKQ